MASKTNIQDEVRKIVNETASAATAKALEVAEQAKQKAAEVSSLAISKALDASTLAATKAAEAAAAAASIAASTSKDLEYIKADIAATKLDIKSINEKLDNKYVSKEDFRPTKDIVDKIEDKYSTKQELLAHSVANEAILSEIKTTLAKLVTTDQFSTVKTIVYGQVGLIVTGFITGLIYLLIRKP